MSGSMAEEAHTELHSSRTAKGSRERRRRWAAASTPGSTRVLRVVDSGLFPQNTTTRLWHQSLPPAFSCVLSLACLRVILLSRDTHLSSPAQPLPPSLLRQQTIGHVIRGQDGRLYRQADDREPAFRCQRYELLAPFFLSPHELDLHLAFT